MWNLNQDYEASFNFQLQKFFNEIHAIHSFNYNFIVRTFRQSIWNELLPLRVFEESEVELEILFEKFDLGSNSRNEDHPLLLTLELLSWPNFDVFPIRKSGKKKLLDTLVTSTKNSLKYKRRSIRDEV